MAFTGTSVTQIALDIEARIKQVGRLAIVVDSFDDSELTMLRSKVRMIVSGSGCEASARTLVMAFALWICKIRFSNLQAFWQEFERQLEIIGVDQNYVRNRLLEPAFFDHDIPLWEIQSSHRSSRRFVDSLMEERQESLATLQQIREFFLWYFRHSRGVDINEAVLARYNQQKRQILPMTSQAMTAMNADCQKLARIVELAIERDISLGASTDWDRYCQALVESLGPEHDPSQLRIIRDREALRGVILELQNHRTPAQFLRELERSSQASVQVPGSGFFSVANLRGRRADELNYGLYAVQANSSGPALARSKTEFRVVPCAWLSFESMRNWPVAKSFTPRSGWLGYRKNSPFWVSVGGRQVASRRCFFPDGSSTFLWVGEIVAGQKLLVDGVPVPQTEGVTWETAFRLSRGERAPSLSLVILKLLAHVPGAGGAKVEISTSSSQSESRDLEPDGSLALYRDVRFPVRRFDSPLKVQMRAGRWNDEHTFDPPPAWLFSAYTGEKIAPSRSRQQDGRRFVLFCAPDLAIEAAPGVALTPIESGLAPFHAWQVEWMATREAFHLRVGELVWDIERPRYFEAWLEPHEPQVWSDGAAGVMLALQQRHDFQEGTVRVATNRTLDVASLQCRFSCGEEMGIQAPVSEVLQARGSDAFFLSKAFAYKLNEAVAGRCGHYTLRFFEVDEEEEEHVLAEVSLSIVPRLRVQLERRFVLETEPVMLRVESAADAPLWNATSQNSDETTTLALFPAVEVLPPRSKEDSSLAEEREDDDRSSVPRLKGQVVSGLVALPSLGESLRVAAQPALLGFRLFRRMPDGGWWESADADWFSLDEFSLRVFTGARAQAKIFVNDRVVREEQADRDGQIALDDLRWLKPLCSYASTSVAIASAWGGQMLRCSFLVRFSPRVFDLSFDGSTVVVESVGPKDGAIVLRFQGESGVVEELLSCTGKEATLSCTPTHDANGELPRSVTALSWHGDGDPVPSSHRLVLNTNPSSPDTARRPALPDEWLRAGIGFSSREEMERQRSR